ncbi:heme exporter protein CcmD [Aquimonas voraii]|uniref:Heme exporter protein D n=1 Tax=Aquimonas voraii TaxID=265719 RepID=A0A1G6XNP4_9GAMM|nr:heme exporter protein CcmD [Aquimonas voraii]SDD79814.1 Heme exporter protein D (CcmD) [Aquimonas voraii]
MSGWLDMGEYSAFVWACFAIFFVFLLWDLVQPAWRLRRLQREIALRARREAARSATTTEHPIP